VSENHLSDRDKILHSDIGVPDLITHAVFGDPSVRVKIHHFPLNCIDLRCRPYNTLPVCDDDKCRKNLPVSMKETAQNS